MISFVLSLYQIGVLTISTYNASPKIYPPPAPLKFCITIVFDFSWVNYNTQEKLETIVMQNLGGKQGALWSMWKWWVLLLKFLYRSFSDDITAAILVYKKNPVKIPFSSIWTLLSCKNFLLFHEICAATNHLSENYNNILRKYKSSIEICVNKILHILTHRLFIC